jgi:hypothetical protein
MADKRKTTPRVRPFKQPSVKELERRRGRKLTAEDMKAREEIEALGLKVLEIEPGEELTDEEVLFRLTCGLRSVVDDAFAGDASALDRLLQIHQLIYPEPYNLNPSISRAMAIRRQMAALSRVVMPVSGDSFQGGVAAVRLTDDEGWHRDTLYKLAAKHWRRGVTLQSLAIRICLAQLQKEGFDAIDRKTLERDISALKRYDGKTQAQDYILLSDGEVMPSYPYTEKWKLRKTTPRKVS